MPSTRARLRSGAGAARNQTQFQRGLAGLAQSSPRLVRDASRYWSAQPGNRWQNDSHWRSGSKFAGQDRWAAIGQQHLDLFQRMRGSTAAVPFKRVIEWGCGGGASAVAFAPLTQEFVGVDVAADSVEESARRVAAAELPDRRGWHHLPHRGFLVGHEELGFRPEVVSLVAQNDLDERYAYFLLIRT
jgi:hypothetical protein